MDKKQHGFYGDPMAEVAWRAEDVQALRPAWALEQCEDSLAGIERQLRDRLTELGWEVLDDLLEPP